MSKFQKFEEEIDFGHSIININNNNNLQNQNINSNDICIQNQNRNQTQSNNIKATLEMNPNTINIIISNLNFIGKYFNVEIEDIQQKFLQSLIPLRKGFNQLAEDKPDLYGPFWIYTTLIFIVVVTSNISAFLNVIMIKDYEYFLKT